MKFSKIALAVASAFVAGQALAAGVTPAEILAARNAGTLQQTWLSGASASVLPAGVAFYQGCTSGTASVFTAAASGDLGSLGNYMAYACKVGSTVKLAFHSIDAGSATTYLPHTDADMKLDRLKATWGAGSIFAYSFDGVSTLTVSKTTATTGCSATATTLTGTNQAAIPGATLDAYYNCAMEGLANAAAGANLGAANAAVPALGKPEGGLSDVEAALFNIDAGAIGEETKDIGVGQGFGVAVTPKLYRALQIKQGIFPAGTVFGDAPTGVTGFTDDKYDPAFAPTISSLEYASIVSAGGSTKTNWSPILGTAALNYGFAGAAAANVTPTDKKIVLARRVDTSGTQAASNAFFLNAPCASNENIGGQLSVASLGAGDATANFIITEGSGTGDAKKALTSANNNADATKNFAIGVLSLENDFRAEKVNDSIGYRFVKVNGVSPEEGSFDGSTTFSTVVKNTATPAVTISTNTYNKYFARTNVVKGLYGFQFDSVAFKKTGITPAGDSIITGLVSGLKNIPSCGLTPRGIYLSKGQVNGASCTTVAAATATNLPEINTVSRGSNSCSPLFY